MYVYFSMTCSRPVVTEICFFKYMYRSLEGNINIWVWFQGRRNWGRGRQRLIGPPPILPEKFEYFFTIPLFRPEYISSMTMSTDLKFTTANFKAKHSCKVLTEMEFFLAFFMYFLKMLGLKGLVTPSSGGQNAPYRKCAELMKKRRMFFCLFCTNA
jgi:hypothetical protein